MRVCVRACMRAYGVSICVSVCVCVCACERVCVRAYGVCVSTNERRRWARIHRHYVVVATGDFHIVICYQVTINKF